MNRIVVTCETVDTVDAPQPRSGHTATLVGKEVVFFGGVIDGQCTSAVDAVSAVAAKDDDTLTWRRIAPPGIGPSPRLGHAACAVSSQEVGSTELFVFGGGDGKVLLNDLWALDPAAAGRWRSPQCSGSVPASRMGHALEHLPARGALLSFGGFVKGVKGGYSTQVLLLDLGAMAWSEPRVTPPPQGEPPIGRLGAALCCVPSSGHVLVLGGSAKGATLSEVLLLDTEAWSLAPLPPPAGGAAPWARAHGALFLAPPVALHVGGAKEDEAPLLDVLDLESLSWRPSEVDARSAALLGAGRLKHGMARVTYRKTADGRATAAALLWGGELPGGAEAPAQLCRLRLREMPPAPPRAAPAAPPSPEGGAASPARANAATRPVMRRPMPPLSPPPPPPKPAQEAPPPREVEVSSSCIAGSTSCGEGTAAEARAEAAVAAVERAVAAVAAEAVEARALEAKGAEAADAAEAKRVEAAESRQRSADKRAQQQAQEQARAEAEAEAQRQEAARQLDEQTEARLRAGHEANKQGDFAKARRPPRTRPPPPLPPLVRPFLTPRHLLRRSHLPPRPAPRAGARAFPRGGRARAAPRRARLGRQHGSEAGRGGGGGQGV